MEIYGQLVDDQSRCHHYHGPLDIVALKCFTCRRYYSCYQCHDSLEEHSFGAYPKELWEDLVVLCGVCHKELTIHQYQSHKSCPDCNHFFNPACKLHEDIYFKG